MFLCCHPAKQTAAANPRHDFELELLKQFVANHARGRCSRGFLTNSWTFASFVAKGGILHTHSSKIQLEPAQAGSTQKRPTPSRCPGRRARTPGDNRSRPLPHRLTKSSSRPDSSRQTGRFSSRHLATIVPPYKISHDFGRDGYPRVSPAHWQK